jgi:hypothetical protein
MSLKIEVKSVGSNRTEVHLRNSIVYFSYNQAVAAYDRNQNRYVRTNKFWSRTTSKHIGQFVPNDAEKVDQSVIDAYLDPDAVWYLIKL